MNTTAVRASSRAVTPAVYLSIVLPCCNEGQVLRETHRRVHAVCQALGHSTEIVLVNDGSTDTTWAQILELVREYPNLVALNLSRNHGHQLALSAGLHFASGQRVLIMDADLQDPPELLPDMLRIMDRGADVVYAQRRSRPGDAPLKRLFCLFYYRLLRRMADVQIPLDTGDFRLISRRVCDAIVGMPERQRFIRGMVSWVGFRQEPILYDRDARFAGESKYPFRKLLALAVDGLFSSTLRPLAFTAVLGGLATISAFLLLGYAILSWLFIGKTPPGWTSLLATVVLFGGIQLLVLGVVGEYLSRIYIQVRQRPMFMIDQILRSSDRGEDLS